MAIALLRSFPFLLVVLLIDPSAFCIKSKGRPFGAAWNPCWLKLALTRRTSRAANRRTLTRAAWTSAGPLPFKAGSTLEQQFPLALAIHRKASIARQIYPRKRKSGRFR